MKIPVANIYYLLAYAWNKLEESRISPVSADACDTPLDLLAHLLVGGTSYLFKKGLDRSYREQEERIPAVKGKLLVGESVKTLAFQRGKAVCRYDVFDHDVLHNRILKATLNRLCRVAGLDEKIRREARTLYLRFHEVGEPVLTKAMFGQVQLHRNNRFYGFLMNVCELLFDNLLPDEKSGKYKFKDFLKDDDQMGRLFEEFVRNFYRMELSAKEYRISRDDIRWQFSASDSASLVLLPKMQTDITIRTASRKIIMDTKYYKDVLTHHHGTEKLRREHLSQLFSYLKNQVEPSSDPNSATAEGILLYATAGSQFRHDYQFESHRLAIRSVDLSGEWREIREGLLGCL